MLTADDFITHLERLDDPAEQRRLIEREAASLTDETVQRMKARANDLLDSNIARGVALAENIIYASQVSGQPVHRALGLMVQANAHMWRGDQHAAIRLYDEAQAVALAAGNPVEAARSQVGKVGALMYLGEHRQAIAIAQKTGDVLASHGQFLSASTVYVNAANCYSQLEQNDKALEEYRKAEALLESLDSVTSRKHLRLIYYNISVALCNLGRYHESLEYSQQAYDIAHEYGMLLDETKFLQSTANSYYSLGDYNKALRLFHQISDVLEQNNLLPFLINCKYYMSSCYLELGRYEEAVEQAEIALKLLRDKGQVLTIPGAFANLYLGRAWLALGELDQSQQALLAANQIAEQLNIPGFKQRSNLHLAALCIEQGQPHQAELLLKELLQNTGDQHIGPSARMQLANIELERANFSAATLFARQALSDFEGLGTQGGIYQAYYLLGQIHQKEGQLEEALGAYQQSIENLEQLRGRVASETRSMFLRSKGKVYEAAVALSLQTEAAEGAFNLVERVKSRALVELVGNQLDIRVKVRDEADGPLVAEIEGLRMRHNDLTGRLSIWQENAGVDDLTGPTRPRLLTQAEREELVQEVKECEKRLAELTERLQVKNAHYAEDVTLAPTYRSFDRTTLQPDEVLVEYYVAGDELVAFVVTRESVEVVRGLTTVALLNRQLSFFRLNLAGTVKSLGEAAQMEPAVWVARREGLIRNSQALLQKLYALLLAPLAPLLAPYKRLVIVPHGSLHYLPFQALYNGATGQYLLETFEEVVHLPAASLLGLCRDRASQTKSEGALVLGFSNCGALPCTVEEASQVAATLGCEPYLEEAASLERFRASAPTARLIHLAAHGRYREDAPLFSSLLLAQGELTGYEFFNTELQASLICLSACDSGLGAIGGGDEVLGFSRACLYAGASSLTLSLWRVDDRAGSLLMTAFYRYLLAGQTKAAALRQAQLNLLNDPTYRHPFYWAPFILIGDSGRL